MKDRLGELQGASQPVAIAVRDVGNGVGGSAAVGDGEGGEQQTEPTDYDKGRNFMKDFFRDVNSVKADIDEIRQACNRMDPLTNAYNLAENNAKEGVFKDEMTALIASTNKCVMRSKGVLKGMLEETAAEEKRIAAERAGKDGKRKAEIRVRANLQTTLQKKFLSTSKDYENAQNKYKTTVKRKAKRLVNAVRPSGQAAASDEELEAVFDQEGGLERVLQAAVLQKGDPVEVANVLEEVKGVYQEVQRLESSIMELHQMFCDVALLVAKQSEMLDQIENNVSQAEEHIISANKNIDNAITSAKTIRKRQCCLIGVVLVILAIIVLAMFIFA